MTNNDMLSPSSKQNDENELRDLIWTSDLLPQEKIVLMALIDCYREDIIPSVKYLAWRIGFCERTIQRVIRRLEMYAILDKSDEPAPFGLNRYEINRYLLVVCDRVVPQNFLLTCYPEYRKT